jgi:hypothetical protein
MLYVWLPQLAPMRRLPEFKAYMHEIGMVAYWQEYGWPDICRPLEAGYFECDWPRLDWGKRIGEVSVVENATGVLAS